MRGHYASTRGEKYLATPDRAYNWHVSINNNSEIGKFGVHARMRAHVCVRTRTCVSRVCTCACLAPVHLSV